MTGDLHTDGRYLTEKQYSDDSNLAARQSIYVFQQPVMDIWNGSLDLAGLHGDERVLDIGCGNGFYLGALRGRGHRGLVCGADLSEGMLRSARDLAGTGPLLVSDAQNLPFADDSFDLTLAMHMLYHVPDRAAAIAELRRVLRSDGVALVVTNSETHLLELDDLLVDAARAAVGLERLPVRSHVSFTAENAPAELARQFSQVTARDFVSELVITEVAPVVAYAQSMGAWVADTEHELDAVIPEIERRVAAAIATDGAFRVRSVVACFVCR